MNGRLTKIVAVVFCTACLSSPALADDDAQKVIVPFDFQSKFDDGRYGQIVGDMIWKKLDRQGKFVIPETMLDVRDTVRANNLKLNAATPLDRVQKVVQDQFGAQIAIWGDVERVAGNEWDVYDLKIRCVDFSTKPKPSVIYSVDARTKTVSEIPHKYLKAMFESLEKKGTGSFSPGNSEAATPLSEKRCLSPFSPQISQQAIESNWAKNPNLVPGGDFQTASKTNQNVPLGWDTHGGQLREPVGNLVRWQRDGENRFLRLSFDKALGDTFGVMYYSDPFPVTEGATYRFTCRWRTDGPTAKVFVKCYAETTSAYHEEKATGSFSLRNPEIATPLPEKRCLSPFPHLSTTDRLREVYRSQQNLKGPKNRWNTQTEDFTPKHTKYTPRWGRVMLYGYLGAGNVDFDDVVIKEIIPASPQSQTKARRHSLESDVTIKEQEENRLRSDERKRGQKKQQNPTSPPSRN